jgi:probable biosynthetic protein (TIGR04098 family)
MEQGSGKDFSSLASPWASAEEGLAAIVAALPGGAPADRDAEWPVLGLDSFDLLSLRLAAEQALGRDLTDAEWLAARTPRRLLALAPGPAAPPAAAAPAAAVAIKECIELGMPQMAMGGLSEGWLLRTLGDLHWRLIGAGLGTPPSAIADGLGNRLYPAFSRIRYAATAPLARFEEGEILRFAASLARHGGSIFLSTMRIAGEGGRAIEAELMSTFSYRATAGRNVDLQRGQPLLPPGCPIPAHEAMPAFAEGYRERRRRSAEPRPVLAHADYELLPQHDINGVGLLYFAAYPAIADICEMRASGRGAAWALEASPVARDICYFANADVDHRLEWRLHGEAADGGGAEASIVRDDGVAMADLLSRRVAR